MALSLPRSIRRPFVITLIPGLLLGGFGAEHSAVGAQSLAAQLNRLSREEGFAIAGIEKLEPGATAEQTEGTPTQRVRFWLEEYDYAIVHKTKDRIDRLIILGKKRAAPATAQASAETETSSENVVPTQRRGSHHWVAVTLQGPAGKPVAMELMVDTGASLVALPDSKAAELGLDTKTLETRQLQTAKGKLEAKVGHLKAIELGSSRLQDIEAAFVSDELLGGIALLGMNVLGRYVFILDDERNELTLIPDAKK